MTTNNGEVDPGLSERIEAYYKAATSATVGLSPKEPTAPMKELRKAEERLREAESQVKASEPVSE